MVDHLPQLMAWRKTGVNEGQELLSDVGGDGLGEWRVEPGDCPASRLGAGFGGSWLLADRLVVVGGLVQGLQEDVGWVGEVVDVLQLTQSLSLFKKKIGAQMVFSGGKSALRWEQKVQMSGGKCDKLGGGKRCKGKWTTTSLGRVETFNSL